MARRKKSEEVIEEVIEEVVEETPAEEVPVEAVPTEEVPVDNIVEEPVVEETPAEEPVPEEPVVEETTAPEEPVAEEPKKKTSKKQKVTIEKDSTPVESKEDKKPEKTEEFVPVVEFVKNETIYKIPSVTRVLFYNYTGRIAKVESLGDWVKVAIYSKSTSRKVFGYLKIR